ncbi:thiamine phosphate synthase [Paenibacillus chibensis]|uniref:thiamine phosphate synthase n=1 Tax=Paenibacillus chibensis TaxID=59846 RepID=UPI000FD9FEC5|nr:thiamine phosphate synthase [Paenibacillus chibensis]MEC0369751.1 thiamine phosphate synthase [Paenibacillus chibensis]
MTGAAAEQLRNLLRLYIVLGSTNCKGDPAVVTAEAIRGGATMIQFREKGPHASTGAAKEKLARRIQAVCRANGIPFIVNDDIELALAVDADGVHIGQDDEPASQVREKIGNKWLGLSVHTAEEAKLAAKLNVDYIGVGPVYPTASKADAREACGTAAIREIREHGVTLPLVAIGGITPERVQEVVYAGADGIAVISAVTSAPDSRHAAQKLARELNSAFWRYGSLRP